MTDYSNSLDQAYGVSESQDNLAMNPLNSGNVQSERDARPSSVNESTNFQHQASNTQNNRENWGSQIQFILVCAGSTAFRSFWTFPYLCYANGGARVFLIPHFVTLILGFVPFLFLELYIGQNIRQGPIGVFKKLCPIFKGIGAVIVMFAFLTTTYLNIFVAWGLFYFFASFQDELPWTQCNQTWNSQNCSSYNHDNHDIDFGYGRDLTTIPEDYFNNRVLKINSGIDDLGSIRWELVGLLALAWVIIYLCLFKGVTSMGKVAYFTTTIPFVVLIILLIRCVTLPGAQEGILFLTLPNWALLWDSRTWLAAAFNNFWSLGLDSGSMIVLASYSNFKTRTLVLNTAVITFLNTALSVLSSFVVFSAIGFLASEEWIPVGDVARAGASLLFITFPDVYGRVPVSQLWCVLLFVMFLCIAIGNQFTLVEVVVATFKDAFPFLRKFYFNRKEVLVAYICIFSFLLGLPNATQGGLHFVYWIDDKLAIVSMVIAILLITAVTLFYGAYLLKRRMVFLLVLLLLWLSVTSKLIQYMEYDVFNKKDFDPWYFPSWGKPIGWLLVCISLVWIPLGAIHAVLTSEGSIKQRFLTSLTLDLTKTTHTMHTENAMASDFTDITLNS